MGEKLVFCHFLCYNVKKLDKRENEKMKILITTDLFTTATNGVVTSVKNLYEELVKKGHEIRILTFSENKTSYKKGPAYFIGSRPFNVYPDVRCPSKFRHPYVKELIEWKPDVIHSQCEFFSFQFAKRIAKKTKAPIVHTYHTLYEQYVTYVIPFKRLGKRLVRVASRWRLKRVRTIIAPTKKVENTLHFYKIKNDIRVIPSGISLSQHKTRLSNEERAAKRAELGVAENQFALLNLGRLGTEKNLEELLNFFVKARQKHPDLVFLIVGDGPDKQALEKLAADLGIADNVIFTGMVAPDDVQKYYQLGDLFVGASTSETQGLTYVEAAANGLPLLCRKDPCLEDILQDGKNGFEYTTEEEFLEKLDGILTDETWHAEAKLASERAAEPFDKSNFAAAVENVYLTALTPQK